MTGFGEAHSTTGPLQVSAEVRTINSRHLKVSLRCAEGYGSIEPLVEEVVRRTIRRGTAQVNLRTVRTSGADDYRVNIPLLRAYAAQLEQAFPHRDGAASYIAALLQLPGVVEEQRGMSDDPQQDWESIEPVLEQACLRADAMRRREGQALAADLLDQCNTIGQQLEVVAERSPLLGDEYRSRLTERVERSLASLGVTVQPVDLVREVALFCDRSDISEEIVRLRSHLQQFHSTVTEAEGGGRKLEFISQEMGREVNTIGSKANDTLISARVVEMKTALERIREQVQNVE